jgi:probable rRNA maturation factor
LRRKRKTSRRPERATRVDVSWATRSRPISDRSLRRAVREAARQGRRAGEAFAIVLVGDRALARMHARWLDDASPTDVMTFDLGGAGGGPVGEVYASAERAVRVAKERGVSPERELALYVVHGILHLCGYDDRTSAQRRAMRAAETAVLDRLGYERDAFD